APGFRANVCKKATRAASKSRRSKAAMPSLKVASAFSSITVNGSAAALWAGPGLVDLRLAEVFDGAALLALRLDGTARLDVLDAGEALALRLGSACAGADSAHDTASASAAGQVRAPDPVRVAAPVTAQDMSQRQLVTQARALRRRQWRPATRLQLSRGRLAPG